MKRKVTRNKQGLCKICPRPLVAGRTLCQRCLDRLKAYNKVRMARADNGTCTQCFEPVVLGRRKCQKHLMKGRLWGLKDAGLPKQEIEKAIIAWAAFDGHCQCCGGTACNTGNDWCLDHDHARLTFRGIIGHQCNAMLGYVKDDPEILIRQADYLKRSLE
jgi:hypothetical protein